MKKAALLIILALVVALGVMMIAGASNSDVELSPDEIKMTTGDSVGVLTNGKVNFRFTFFVAQDDIDELESAADELSVFAVIADYTEGVEPDAQSGVAVELSRGDKTVIGGKSVYTYTLLLGGINEDNVKDTVSVRGYVRYTDNGETHTVASDFGEEQNVINPFDAVYRAYCDESYEKGTDVNVLRNLLASHLSVKIENGVAVDELSGEGYESVYQLEYFDGVLTVSLSGGAIPEWLISTLTVNGTERYFEIYEGRIRIVV